jgi:hypothetical protein
MMGNNLRTRRKSIIVMIDDVDKESVEMMLMMM